MERATPRRDSPITTPTTSRSPHRRSSLLLAIALLAALLPAGTAAAAGDAGGGSGDTSRVTAQPRTSLELWAEAVLNRGHAAQRSAGRTRAGARFDDVAAVGPLQGWTDVTTVARRWSDRLSFDDFAHNPTYARQYGHWRAAGENIAMTTIRPAGAEPTRAQVAAAAEQLLQNWWESQGHRRNWMNPAFDHVGIGASVQLQDVPGVSQTYWVLTATANFRGWNGTEVDGSRYPLDGSLPPNEVAPRPAPTARDLTRTCPSSSAGFDDVARDGVFAHTVGCASDLGLTVGVDGRRFRPGGRVTFAQMSLFTTRALEEAGVDLPEGSCGSDGVFDAALGVAVAMGAMDAHRCGDGAVALTRSEMARFVAAALASAGVEVPAAPTDWFADDDAHANAGHHDVAAELGIVVGTGDGRFAPDAKVTRAQMTVFLCGLVDALQDG